MLVAETLPRCATPDILRHEDSFFESNVASIVNYSVWFDTVRSTHTTDACLALGGKVFIFISIPSLTSIIFVSSKGEAAG